MLPQVVPSFKRKVIVTRGADSTVVVEYASKEAGLRIVEFQGIYVVYVNGTSVDENTPAWKLGAALHQAEEALRSLEEQVGDTEEQQEIEAAERRAGWDPNP